MASTERLARGRGVRVNCALLATAHGREARIRQFLRGAAALIALALAFVLVTNASSSGAVKAFDATHRSGSIVARMGLPMSEAAARHGIAFRPFAPPRRITGVALLPPFHGDDQRASRGIAFEYMVADGHRYVLAEWPANGGRLNRFTDDVTILSECATARMFPRGTKPDGIVWSTPHGLIMTFQADGTNDARTVQLEWIKLIRRGVCR